MERKFEWKIYLIHGLEVHKNVGYDPYWFRVIDLALQGQIKSKIQIFSILSLSTS